MRDFLFALLACFTFWLAGGPDKKEDEYDAVSASDLIKVNGSWRTYEKICKKKVNGVWVLADRPTTAFDAKVNYVKGVIS